MSRSKPRITPQPAALPADLDRTAATVIVGFDGTPTSWGALWWACGEARRLDGRVIAVYVTCTPDSNLSTAAMISAGFDAGGYAVAAERNQAERAAELRAEVRDKAADVDVEVSFLHVRGPTAEQLLRVARDAHADVIAVGRSTRLRHHLAGSLGRRLTRNRNAPIVVIVP